MKILSARAYVVALAPGPNNMRAIASVEKIYKTGVRSGRPVTAFARPTRFAVS